MTDHNQDQQPETGSLYRVSLNTPGQQFYVIAASFDAAADVVMRHGKIVGDLRVLSVDYLGVVYR
jgi:hypothetical protein